MSRNLTLVMKELCETEQRSSGHRYRELGISDMKPADPIGGCESRSARGA